MALLLPPGDSARAESLVLFPEIFTLLSVRMAMWKQLHLSFDLWSVESSDENISWGNSSPWVVSWASLYRTQVVTCDDSAPLPSGPFLVYQSSLEPDVAGVPRHLVLEPESLSLPVSSFPNRPARLP